MLAESVVGGARPAIATPLDPSIQDHSLHFEQTWVITFAGRERVNPPLAVNGATIVSTGLVGLGSAIPAGAIITEFSSLRFRVDIVGAYGIRRMVVDASSPPFEVTGYGVVVTPLVPATHVEVIPGEAPPTLAIAGTNGVDSEMAAAISRVEAPTGKRFAVLTEQLTAAAGVAARITVPGPHVRDVTVYQTGVGNVSPAWTINWGTVGSAPVAAGLLPFIPAVRRTEQLSIPPNATELVTDIDPLNARSWAVVWTMKP